MFFPGFSMAIVYIVVWWMTVIAVYGYGMMGKLAYSKALPQKRTTCYAPDWFG